MGRFSILFIILQSVSFIALSQDSSALIFSEAWNPLTFSLNNLYQDELGKDFRKEISLSGNGDVHSSTVNLPFSLALVRNEFIDDEKKNDVSSKLNKMNVLEFGYGFNLNYRWITDSFLFRGPALYTLNFTAGYFSSTQFTDDLFNTVFYGNAHFAGQTADFSTSHNYDFAYDKIGFAAQKKIVSENSSWELGGGISLLGIRNLTKVHLTHATLFTEENGEYLDADYDYELITSDSSNHGGFLNFFDPNFNLSPGEAFDGFGVSTDLQASFLSSSKKTKWNLRVNDLGFAKWNKNTLTYTADSMIHFTGLEGNHLLSFDSTSVIHFNKDSLLKLTGTSIETGARTTILPFNISLEYLHWVSSRFIIEAGISYRPSFDMLPLLFFKPQWNLNAFQIAPVLSFGGNTSYALGIVSSVEIKKQFKILLGSDNILGLVLPKETTSSSVFLQMAFRF